MSNGASDFIRERKKMGVKTNHGLKFGKKKDGCIRFDRGEKTRPYTRRHQSRAFGQGQ